MRALEFIKETITKPPVKLPTRVKPIQNKKDFGSTMRDAGIPAGVGQTIEAPPMPKQAGESERLETLPDGRIRYSSGFGSYVYDKTGKPLTYTTPNFAGLFQIHDLVTGNITVRYAAGPLDITANYDKNGKSLDSTQVQYDLGLGVVSASKDSGIITKSWKPRGPDEEDPITTKDLYAMGDEDKEATYDRAMAQVNKDTQQAQQK